MAVYQWGAGSVGVSILGSLGRGVCLPRRRMPRRSSCEMAVQPRGVVVVCHGDILLCLVSEPGRVVRQAYGVFGEPPHE